MAMRDDAHQLVDSLAEDELPAALRLLRSLRGRKPAHVASFKDMLRSMPTVGDDADFERLTDHGRAMPE